jgi:hypothetical protein
VTDGIETVEDSYQYVVVYNPEGGFVTGGGWIYSPPGAHNANPDDPGGRANFGFVAKYKKGANEPTGNTQFKFSAGDLSFHSSSYQWLVIAGAKAMFKGTGTINDEGSYKFMISAIDGDLKIPNEPDKFRIKIWEELIDENEFEVEIVIYDNNPGSDEDADPTTELGGGQILIHKG